MPGSTRQSRLLLGDRSLYKVQAKFAVVCINLILHNSLVHIVCFSPPTREFEVLNYAPRADITAQFVNNTALSDGYRAARRAAH